MKFVALLLLWLAVVAAFFIVEQRDEKLIRVGLFFIADCLPRIVNLHLKWVRCL